MSRANLSVGPANSDSNAFEVIGRNGLPVAWIDSLGNPGGNLGNGGTPSTPTQFSTVGAIDSRDFLNTGNNFGQIITDGSWLINSSVLHSGGMSQWTSALVGAVVFATQSCRTGVSNLDTNSAVVPIGTVISVQSPTQLTVSTTSAAAVASGGCIVIGQLQDTQMAAITAAVNANTGICPSVNLHGGVYLISSVPGFMAGQPVGCANYGLVQGQEFGQSGGFLISGDGPNSTVISIVPTLLPSSCSNGSNNSACFVIPAGGQWRNFRITGNGLSMNGRADNTKAALELDGGYTGFRDMVFDSWGTGDTGFVGVRYSGGGVGYTFESLVDAWGNNAVVVGTSQNLAVRNFVVQNTCGAGNVFTVTGAELQSQGGLFIQLPSLCTTAPNRSMLSLTNSSAYISGVGDTVQFGAGSGVNSNGLIVDSSSFARLTSFSAQAHQAGFAVQNSGIVEATASGFTGGASGTAFLNQSTGIFYDNGLNGISGTTGFSNSGKVFGSASITGTASAIGNWALTSGWGTSTVASAVGDSHRTKVSVTTTVTGSASPVLTWTFPTPYFVAPSTCSMSIYSNATLTNVIPGTPTATSVAFTLVGTPTATTTYTFDVSCGP